MITPATLVRDRIISGSNTLIDVTTTALRVNTQLEDWSESISILYIASILTEDALLVMLDATSALQIHPIASCVKTTTSCWMTWRNVLVPLPVHNVN